MQLNMQKYCSDCARWANPATHKNFRSWCTWVQNLTEPKQSFFTICFQHFNHLKLYVILLIDKMLISIVNNVRIYNLSGGKAIPDWLSDRKKRQLLKKNKELRQKTELIQDLEMPVLSTNIVLSPDQNYLFVTGMYKPRLRCYDFRQMAMKFERCFDSECVKMMVLSDDFTKIAMLQQDRHIEFHNSTGYYFKIRIPKPGRDFCYDYHNCIMYSCGASCDIFRLNLDIGAFEDSLVSDREGFNSCVTSSDLHLTLGGSVDGTIECWDSRVSNTEVVKSFDCSMFSPYLSDSDTDVPAITSMKFKDNLNLAVGTQTGQIFLFDIRTNKPYTIKDHYFGLPIKALDFHSTSNEHDLVLSLDEKVLKFWNRDTGETFTAIQPEKDLNGFCAIPRTGMVFLTNEGQKVQPYYIPALGPAPKWCSYLDQITEELEEDVAENKIYDDYKFVTMQELEELGLEHLIGTNLLRAQMHGFFIDMKLYSKAKAAANPHGYDEYRRNRIKEKLSDERTNRVTLVNSLPKVNRKIFAKMLQKKEQSIASNSVSDRKLVIEDSRFKAMFENPDFNANE